MPVLILFAGLCIGSFLNVLIDRLPKGEDVIFGRSYCDHCKKPLRPWELIPLFSFLALRARCARCHRKLSFQYPLIELVTGVLTLILWLRFSVDPVLFALSLPIAYTLLVIFVADLKEQIVPDSMVVLGTLGTLTVLLYTRAGIFPHILSGALSSLGFFLLWVATKGRGMGFGDVKLVFFLGLLTGFPAVVVSLYAAFLTGALVGVILILSGAKTLKSKVAFGPFLTFGAVVALLYHREILMWWKGVI